MQSASLQFDLSELPTIVLERLKQLGVKAMQVMGIATKNKSRARMQLRTEVAVTLERGIIGDYRGRRGKVGKRQVTLLSLPQWKQACDLLGVELPWHTRRANVLVDDVQFGPTFVGRRIAFAGGTILEVTGETEPCERMDEAHQGLRAALSSEWRGGVTCRVVQGGTIDVNRRVWFVP